jgi:hypothetical protein
MRAIWVDDFHFIAFLPLPPQPNIPIEIAHLVFMLSLVEVGFENRQLRTYVCKIKAVYQGSRLKAPPGNPSQTASMAERSETR